MNHQNVLPSALKRNGVTTRSQDNLLKIRNNMQNNKAGNITLKRKAQESPAKEKATTTKRLAFGDLTNNTGKSTISVNGKKVTVGKVQTLGKSKSSTDKQNIKPSIKLTDIVATTRPASKQVTKPAGGKVLACVTNIAPRKTVAQLGNASVPANTTLLKLQPCAVKAAQKKSVPKTIVKSDTVEVTVSEDSSIYPSSGSSCSSNNTLYVTAREVQSPPDVTLPKRETRVSPAPLIPRVPANVTDFDQENINDPSQVSVYAMDIFNYMRSREAQFKIHNYMQGQLCLTTNMRALLVDWMVEVQETFELNHETLYLAVKLLDLYLDKKTVGKESLQLIGAASMFIASKFDERMPPLIEDFLYVCDGAYTRDEMIKAEMDVVKMIGFDLGIPLSYRFLRRYARCAKVTMPILTLARYILETSLMEYSFVAHSESKLAASALLIALRMKNVSEWTSTLEYYTGYKLADIRSTVMQLNIMLQRHPKGQLGTVRNKYSHKIFFEVAKTPLLTNENLLSFMKS